MKKVILAIVFGLFFVAISNAQTDTKKEEFTVTKEKAVAYQCPMDCEKGKTYDKAGTCSVCKMDLKAKKAGKAKGCCAGAKSSCDGKSKAACDSKVKKAACDGKSKAACDSKAKKAACNGKSKAACDSKAKKAHAGCSSSPGAGAKK